VSRLLEREVMLAPDFVARTAAALAGDPAQRWMLHQPAAVRRSYVLEVMDRDGDENAQAIWMLGQSENVRRGYVADVLAKQPGGGSAATAWMLRQPDSVRASYVAEVLKGSTPGARTTGRRA
jgi:hypothetical protein